MALAFRGSQPSVGCSVQQRQSSLVIRHCGLRMPSIRHQFRISAICPFKRGTACESLKCASIHGFFMSDGEEDSHDFQRTVNDVVFLKKLKEWIDFIRSLGPGGSWWNFSENVGVVILSQPGALHRALRVMWKLVAQDRWLVSIAFSALILAAIAEITIPHFLATSIFSAQCGKSIMFYHNAHLLILLCIMSGICSGLRGYCFAVANMLLVKRMREQLYSSILRQDISFFDTTTVGDLTSRLGADCQQVSSVLGKDISFILRNAIQGAGALIYLLILSRQLGLCTLAISSTLSFVMLLYGQYQRTAAKFAQEFTASSNEVAQETFSLLRIVRISGTEKEEMGRYKQWLAKLADVSLRQSAAFGLWNLSFNALYHSTQVVAVLVGGMHIIGGRITAEQLTKFILYSEWLIYSTWWIGDSISSFMQSVGASEKVFRLMDLFPSDQFVSGGTKLQRLAGHVEFVDVSFCYPSRPSVPVLQRICLKLHPGEVIAIVGLSGSGKSTVVNLLLRLYEPTSGQILIDGFRLRDLDIKWLRGKIAYVGQEPRLFQMDICSNIKYGCPMDVGPEDVEHAAKLAYVHDFISSLPSGYKTVVDDYLLSGGQKQRIAIARAILRDPVILILDEATSALDAESESNIKGALGAARNDSRPRTVIVIAHRLSTVQAADKIVVMDNGRIAEVGTHKDLLVEDSLYARLARTQAISIS